MDRVPRRGLRKPCPAPSLARLLLSTASPLPPTKSPRGIVRASSAWLGRTRRGRSTTPRENCATPPRGSPMPSLAPLSSLPSRTRMTCSGLSRMSGSRPPSTTCSAARSGRRRCCTPSACTASWLASPTSSAQIAALKSSGASSPGRLSDRLARTHGSSAKVTASEPRSRPKTPSSAPIGPTPGITTKPTLRCARPCRSCVRSPCSTSTLAHRPGLALPEPGCSSFPRRSRSRPPPLKRRSTP